MMTFLTWLAHWLWPYGEKATAKQKLKWRFGMFASVVALGLVGSWAMGWTALPGGPMAQIKVLTIEVAGVKESIVCSTLKGQIDQLRAEAYALDREIEAIKAAGGEASELTMLRQDQLMNTLNDNEDRYMALGCVTVLA